MKYRIELEKIGSYSEVLEQSNSLWSGSDLMGYFKCLEDCDERLKQSDYKIRIVDNESDEILEEVLFFQQKKSTKYIVRDSLAGNVIDVFNTMQEAQDAISAYEVQDIEDDVFEEGFYEIYVEGGDTDV